MSRLPLAVAVVAALALFSLPSAASANYRVGIGDQNAAMFDHPAYQALGLKRVRYIVPWDVLRHPGQLSEVDLFVIKANQAKVELLVAFNAPRGCWVRGRYKKTKACALPSVSAYKSAFRKFRARYPSVKVYSPWNEANHKSQPTAKNPGRAAQYFDTVRRECKGCKIVAADVLDQSGATKWLRDFRRKAKGTGKIWGLHNYADVNRKRSSGTRSVLKTVPGELWLTETGGLVKFESSFPYSLSRAAARTRTLFSLADRFDSRRKGYRSKITRMYVYQWYGVPKGKRFDAGLVNPDGSPRPAYKVFKSLARKRLK